MWSRLCVVLLLLTAAVLVQSKSTIERDENGDEYEVKRFNIEGRQLNKTRSQCVVTRRKRATAVIVNDDDSDGQNSRKGGMLLTSPTTVPTVTTSLKETDDENNPDERIGTYSSSNDDDLPVIAHQVDDGKNPLAVGVAAGANAGSMTNVASPNGIVVVQTNKPPKVNPQTHAVFELLPVDPNSSDDRDGNNDDGENTEFEYVYTNAGDDGDGDLHYEEEISPVSTTAIWSTGADDDLLNGDDYGDYDKFEETNTTKKPISKPSKQKPKPKPGKKKPARKPNKQKVKPNRQRPNNRGPVKKRRRPGNNNMDNISKPFKKRPQNNYKPMRQQVNRPNANRRRRRRPAARPLRNGNGNGNGNWNNNRRINANLMNPNKKRKNPNLENTFTRTVTSTQTGEDDDDKDVNCIIINKQPEVTTTTPRPFWNILPVNLSNFPNLPSLNLGGRDAANGKAVDSGAFGKRKRVNMRFIAPSS